MRKQKYTNDYIKTTLARIDKLSKRMSLTKACKTVGIKYGSLQYFKNKAAKIETAPLQSLRTEFTFGRENSELSTLLAENHRLKLALAELYLSKR